MCKLTFLLALFLLSTNNTIAQSVADMSNSIKKEIDNKGIDINNFSKRIKCTNTNGTIVMYKQATVYKYWKSIEALFYDTDYIIKNVVGNTSELKYFEVYNHKHKVVLGLSKKGKIETIVRVKILLPKDAPKED